ncbi:hypothetical protein Gogos_016856 [Gossypium gossypioides]|uniref:Uncharacterized protein n=1 Tax=Gossypium gossypioides TaxID=34282 RepID=A0A7J9B935_GOSGO|nr:hypothetical protein [Gossypium gossypioides]
MAKIVKKYFSDLFTSKRRGVIVDGIEGVERYITTAMNRELTTEYKIEDAWVPGLEKKRIQESVRNNSVNKVVDLIDSNSGQWKEETITRLFTNVEADAILNIPLAKHPREDSRVWSGEPTGEYTGLRRLTKNQMRTSRHGLGSNSPERQPRKYNSFLEAYGRSGYDETKFHMKESKAHELTKEAVTSLRSTDLDYRLPRKEAMLLEEDARHQTAMGGEERFGNRV